MGIDLLKHRNNLRTRRFSPLTSCGSQGPSQRLGMITQSYCVLLCDYFYFFSDGELGLITRKNFVFQTESRFLA